MRVLHVVASSQRRGAEVFASDLIGALDDFEQRVAVLRNHGGPQVSFRAPTDLLGANGGRGPLSMPALKVLRRIIHDWKPEIVQAHGGEPLKYVMASRAASGAAVVYRRIGSAHLFADRPIVRFAYAQLIRRATVTVAVAEAVRQDTIRAFRVDPSRVITIPNAVDGARMLPAGSREQTRAQLSIDPSARVILSLGALTWEKDPVGLLDVAERAMRGRPDVRMLLAGDGPLRPEVESTIVARNLHGRVLVLGSRTDVPDLLHAADVALLASATEGMPAVLIEAGMAGVPVVSYDQGGISEVVVDGATGLLAQPGDDDSLARRLGALLDDDELRSRMGRAARDRCVADFEVDVVAHRYRALYEEVGSR